MNTMVISGRIGTRDIAREDIGSFISSMKDFEWTANNLYKPAKICEVKPTFIQNTEIKNQYQAKQINFDLFLIEENQHLTDFHQYKADIEDRKKQMHEKIEIKKKDFIANFFPNESVDVNDKKSIINLIKANKSKLIQNSNLNSKLSTYVNSLNAPQNFNKFNFDFNLK
jgi:protease II